MVIEAIAEICLESLSRHLRLSARIQNKALVATKEEALKLVAYEVSIHINVERRTRVACLLPLVRLHAVAKNGVCFLADDVS